MEDFATRLVTAISVLLIGGYFIGLSMNRRVGRGLARWVRDGLRVAGGEGTIRWLGSSGFVIDVRGLAPPLTRLTVTALLEPREVPPLWLYWRLRGRRDLLVVRCWFVRRPRRSLEIAAPASFIGRTALAAVPAEQGWTVRQLDDFVVAAPADGAPLGDELWKVFRAHTAGLWQISVRNQDPHLQVSLSPQADSDARAVWRRLIDAALLIGGRGAGPEGGQGS